MTSDTCVTTQLSYRASDANACHSVGPSRQKPMRWKRFGVPANFFFEKKIDGGDPNLKRCAARTQAVQGVVAWIWLCCPANIGGSCPDGVISRSSPVVPVLPVVVTFGECQIA